MCLQLDERADHVHFEFVHQAVIGERNDQLGPSTRKEHLRFAGNSYLPSACQFDYERTERFACQLGFQVRQNELNE